MFTTTRTPSPVSASSRASLAQLASATALIALGMLSAGCGGQQKCVAPETATGHEQGHEHPHEHTHGDSTPAHAHAERKPIESAPPEKPPEAVSSEAQVIRHDDLKAFGNNGNKLTGIATKAHGAASYEVWRTSVAVGSQTPPHSHESEEVFIFLKGKGKAVIGDKEFTFEAPATVIAPAGVPHQFFNTGEVPTDAIVVVGIDSAIYDKEGNAMQLPWRK